MNVRRRRRRRGIVSLLFPFVHILRGGLTLARCEPARRLQCEWLLAATCAVLSSSRLALARALRQTRCDCDCDLVMGLLLCNPSPPLHFFAPKGPCPRDADDLQMRIYLGLLCHLLTSISPLSEVEETEWCTYIHTCPSVTCVIIQPLTLISLIISVLFTLRRLRQARPQLLGTKLP